MDKLELTQELRDRIFAAYLPCDVKCAKQIGWTLSQHIYPSDLHFYTANKWKIEALILKPLSEISDEDKVECAITIGTSPHLIDHMIPSIEKLLKRFYEDLSITIDDTGLYLDMWSMVSLIDKLRELGYDCGHGSISSLLDAGIAIIKPK